MCLNLNVNAQKMLESSLPLATLPRTLHCQRCIFLVGSPKTALQRSATILGFSFFHLALLSVFYSSFALHLFECACVCSCLLKNSIRIWFCLFMELKMMQLTLEDYGKCLIWTWKAKATAQRSYWSRAGSESVWEQPACVCFWCVWIMGAISGLGLV